jgi:hypothetical protein
MRLSVTLDDDLYAVAKALAKSEDCSIGAAINKLLRQRLNPEYAVRPAKLAKGFPTVDGDRLFTDEDVYRADYDE